MMSDPDTVDRTIIEETTGKLVLVIQEDRSWDDPETMHRQLRDKIKIYVRHIRSDGFSAEHGRSPEGTIIRLLYTDPPGEDTVDFLDRVRYELSKLDIDFQHQLEWFGDVSADSPMTVHGWDMNPNRRRGPAQATAQEAEAPEGAAEPEDSVTEPQASSAEPQASSVKPEESATEPEGSALNSRAASGDPPQAAPVESKGSEAAPAESPSSEAEPEPEPPPPPEPEPEPPLESAATAGADEARSEAIEIPDIEIPEIEIPEAEIPDAEIPEAEISESAAPQTDVPEVDVPETDLPDIELPGVEAPELEAGETDIPEAEIQDGGVQELEAQGIEHQEIEVPEAQPDVMESQPEPEAIDPGEAGTRDPVSHDASAVSEAPGELDPPEVAQEAAGTEGLPRQDLQPDIPGADPPAPDASQPEEPALEDPEPDEPAAEDLEPEVPIAEPPSDFLADHSGYELEIEGLTTGESIDEIEPEPDVEGEAEITPPAGFSTEADSGVFEWPDVVGDPEIIDPDELDVGSPPNASAPTETPVTGESGLDRTGESAPEGEDTAGITPAPPEGFGSAPAYDPAPEDPPAKRSMWPEEEFGDLNLGSEPPEKSGGTMDLDEFTKDLAPDPAAARRSRSKKRRGPPPRESLSDSRPRPGRGLMAALGAAIASAIGWPLLAVVSDNPAGPLALVVGLFVGFNVRLRGGGGSFGYRLMAMIGTVLGCGLGGLLTAGAFLMRERGLDTVIERLTEPQAALETIQLFYGISDLGLFIAAVLLSALVAASGKES